MSNFEGYSRTLGEVQALLVEGFERLRDDGEWERFLTYAAKFNQYSPRNLILIYSQASQRGFLPSKVAGYTTWKRLGRSVRKGEKGLQIFSPIVLNPNHVVPESPCEDERRGDRRVLGFRRSHVFDVSQTEGPEVDEPLVPQLLEGQAHGHLEVFMASVIAEAGFGLSFVALDDVNGRTDIVTKTVEVSNYLGELQRLKTLCHECAHVLLHGEGAGNRGEAEVEAESFAYAFLASLGIDSGPYSLPYLMRWAEGDVEQLLRGLGRSLALTDGLVKRYRSSTEALILV